MNRIGTLLAFAALLFCSSGWINLYGRPDSAGNNAFTLSDDSKTPEEESERRTSFSFMLGGSYWKGLGEIEPIPADLTKYGDFGSWGYNLEISVHRSLMHLNGKAFRLGADLGFFFHPSRKSTEVTIYPAQNTLSDSLNARGMYLTPSIRYLWRKNSAKYSPRPYLGCGGGLYGVDVVTMLSDGMVVDTYYKKWTIGGYVSGGIAVPVSNKRRGMALLLEGKVHLVRFGKSESFTAQRLSGPVYMIQLGFRGP